MPGCENATNSMTTVAGNTEDACIADLAKRIEIAKQAALNKSHIFFIDQGKDTFDCSHTSCDFEHILIRTIQGQNQIKILAQ